MLIHPDALDCLKEHVEDGTCCAVVGLSNTGKSTLLRTLVASIPSPKDTKHLVIYVDCNRILDLSEQGFYEAVLRATRSYLREQGVSELVAPIEQAYQQVIHPPSPFAIPLGFIEGVEALCQQAGNRVTLILDEFDDPFSEIEGRIFLNLRALRDRYGTALTYFVGVERTLDETRDDVDTAEFRELFAGHTCPMPMRPTQLPHLERYVQQVAAAEDFTLSEEEVTFLVEEAGGHPGLLHSITQLIIRARTVAPETYARMGTALIAEALGSDEITRRECERIWSQLTVGERGALYATAAGKPTSESLQRRLVDMGLIDKESSFFGAAFHVFVCQRGKRRKDLPPGIWLDAETGEVYIDGNLAPALTELEYRLLEVLFERKNKLCDKYLLVESVWGEDYIDEVDDARIEKLVSRLRAKIEDDPANPRHLVTVRGRGYRLLGPSAK
jgi:hypothetical protein